MREKKVTGCAVLKIYEVVSHINCAPTDQPDAMIHVCAVNEDFQWMLCGWLFLESDIFAKY